MDNDVNQQDGTQPDAGLRRRIVTPAPPAPVPAPRVRKQTPAEETGTPDRSLLTTSPKGETIAPSTPAETAAGGVMAGEAAGVATESAVATKASGEEGASTSNESVVRATGSMAVATLISRITGFIRTVLIGAALGPAVASAFNTANQLPNLITEIVLGSVLTALVVPVLVRAEKEDADRGERFVRQLFTLTLTLMVTVTVLTVVAAPLLTRLFLDDEGKVNVIQATSFAYLVLPQIFFYGMFSLFMAILNTKEHFRPGAWAPVANNVVSIAVLIMYMAIPGSLNPAAPTTVSNPHVLLLGLGTTLGVVVQCAIMLPALRKLGINLTPLWGLDDRLKQFGGMALAIIAYVAVSQAGYIVTTRIASMASEAAPFIYQQHWMLLQVPYGIIGVTLLTAIMPRMSRSAADGDDQAVVRDLTLGTKLTFIALIPIIVFMTGLGPEIGNALFAYGDFSPQAAHILGLTVSFSAFTLIPYALVMLHLRVFYAREEAWTPTLIIAGITLTKIFLSYLAPTVASSPEQVVVLLGAANGFGFVAGAVIGAQLLKRKLGTLQVGTILYTSTWALAASLVGLAATFVLRWIVRGAFGVDMPAFLGSLIGTPSLGLLIEVMLLGLVFLVITGLVLARSGLPEVQNLGRALTRVPGLSRFISPDEKRAIDTGQVDPRDVSTQFLATDFFNASPVPPPMSAGVVRGPRLVPGARVSDGRFRLIREHGATTGARFWQAREVTTGREVALTFVDTTGASPMAPATPRDAAINAGGVVQRTSKIAKLKHPAVADNIEVLSYRTGALVVADWIEGSSVKAVTDSGLTLHTEAVANALAPLAGLLALAQSQDAPLGLDNRQRLRIDTEGKIRLAFPAVLPDSTPAGDAAAFASGLELLTANTNSDALAELTRNTRALVEAQAIEAHDFQDIQAALRREANLPGTVTDHPTRGEQQDLAPASTPTDDPVRLNQVGPQETVYDDPDELRGGFGSRRYSPVAVVILMATAVASVVAIAALTAYLVGFFSSDETDGPLNPESIQGEQDPSEAPSETVDESERATGLPVVIGPLTATALTPDGDPAPKSEEFSNGDSSQANTPPNDVANTVDNDTSTTWVTKRDTVLVLRPESDDTGAFTLEHLLINATSEGGPYEVYGVPEGRGLDTVDFDGLPQLADGTFHTGQNNIDVKSDELSATRLEAVLVYLPPREDADDDAGPGRATLREVSVIGYTDRR
ncbi:putative peptidoglycan biosynthesis protein MviN [Corynebacterium glaucum]|uniref:Putative peptidoglycan biosynthesis protein MviN n=1 Tax=Corynebacterium glaucum TaxID=187491 RepID=A0A1Q2HZU4_9CORY|nr:murein biosynthesis integral membrane protein MurJ [Corynebacterium glaucum]AQQ16372.1 putative peptidoglycan biosynthesis protein MviN [Corynebacterium glaucum]